MCLKPKISNECMSHQVLRAEMTSYASSCLSAHI